MWELDFSRNKTGSGALSEVSHLLWGRWYTLRELEAATNGLADENVIGEGGYGIVYYSVLADNTKNKRGKTRSLWARQQEWVLGNEGESRCHIYRKAEAPKPGHPTRNSHSTHHYNLPLIGTSFWIWAPQKSASELKFFSLKPLSRPLLMGNGDRESNSEIEVNSSGYNFYSFWFWSARFWVVFSLLFSWFSCESSWFVVHALWLRLLADFVCPGSQSGPWAVSILGSGFPLVQTKIVDFFRIQRSSPSAEKLSPDSRKRRRRNSGLVMSKKSRKLLPFNPSKDYIRRLEQMASLATALTATETLFVNELTYVPGMAPRSANCASLEREGMQVISKEDAETLNQCKNMMERGEWPPLMVLFDPLEGFTVEADKFIRDLTIITEYVGDVDYLKNRENDDGDSMMTLLSAADPSKSLVICPDKRSNIARFINGINNHTPDGKKKQNVKCVRFNVNGSCRVLLIASRGKGERLYYDYNGYENEYPTDCIMTTMDMTTMDMRCKWLRAFN
ncbi:unnamed protein product [Fraxinus pennsylvanica]|uniref:SET domain-containing protein n=1 Tax=Fraxinus pennsylvanica TaxID=56036 RepID=A0AAD1ZF05_9LAMI|nr:unnamed protein product [Fraxinus pennsylvanica]